MFFQFELQDTLINKEGVVRSPWDAHRLNGAGEAVLIAQVIHEPVILKDQGGIETWKCTKWAQKRVISRGP